MYRTIFLLSLLSLTASTSRADGIEPREVFLVINRAVPESREIAEHYCKQRKVPAENILAFDLPKGEDISRRDYDTKLLAPLREKLKDRKDAVKVILAIHGVPLRVGSAELRDAEKAELKTLQPRIDAARKEITSLQKALKSLEEKKEGKSAGSPDEIKAAREKLSEAERALKSAEGRRRSMSDAESLACVDSELSLIWREQYDLRRWQVNVLNHLAPDEARRGLPPMVMTCRLDGPTPAIVKKIIDDSIAVEAEGLAGKIYVDARGIALNPKIDATGTGYGGYDQSMRDMAKLLKEKAKLDVVLDDKSELFAKGACPDCAMYCGWYSLANYVDSFTFTRGAVAWHLASSEAVTLRNPNTKQWCKNLLDRGVVATLGPVSEPYTIGFPKPAEFFGYVATGKYTMVECYWKTALLTSWMTVLVADPLYTPYARSPRLSPEDVVMSPAGVIPPFRKRIK